MQNSHKDQSIELQGNAHKLVTIDTNHFFTIFGRIQRRISEQDFTFGWVNLQEKWMQKDPFQQDKIAKEKKKKS